MSARYKVRARFSHVFHVTREVMIEIDEVKEWAANRYGPGYDLELAIAAWIDYQDVEYVGEIFADWKTSLPLPSDFELAYSDIEDVEITGRAS